MKLCKVISVYNKEITLEEIVERANCEGRLYLLNKGHHLERRIPYHKIHGRFNPKNITGEWV